MRQTLLRMATKSKGAELHAKLAESLDTANEEHAGKKTHSRHAIMKTVHAEPAHEAPSLTAARIIDGSMVLAAGAGAIPLPVWDMAAIIGVQVKMLADLSSLYGVPFQKELGRTAVLALIGGLSPGLLAQGSLGIFLKVLPGIGSVVSALAQPALAAGVTYGIGRVYANHLETGGTLLSFSAKDFKDTMAEEVKSGMKRVSEIKL